MIFQLSWTYFLGLTGFHGPSRLDVVLLRPLQHTILTFLSNNFRPLWIVAERTSPVYIWEGAFIALGGGCLVFFQFSIIFW